MPKFKVIRMDFKHLEDKLNSIYSDYPQYHIFQILAEHCYGGALAVVILERNEYC